MRSRHYGIEAILIGSFFFAILTALNRIIPQSVGTFHQLLIRTFIMGTLFLLVGILRKDFISVVKKDFPLILLRGAFIICDFATFFIAVSHLQLGMTLFLFYASTILANYLYGSFILHEKMDRIKVVCFLLALSGLGIMYINNLQAFANIFVFFGLFSGFAYGLGIASSKSLSDKYSVSQVNTMAFLTAALLSIPLLFVVNEKTTITFFTIPWLPFFIFSLTGVIAFYVAIYGFKFVEVQKATLISLAEILFTLAIGFLFYQELPTIQTIIGGLCIVSALVIPNVNFATQRE